MSEALGQIRNQLNEYIEGLENKQKIKIIVGIVFILLSLTGIIYYFTRPEYVVLYNDLDHKQAGEVMNILEANNIRAKFGENSSTIMVQKEDYQKSQVTVATEGLPQSRFSYEDFFSGNNFMKTSEEKSKEYYVALGNELGKILEEIPGVEKAYVTLTVPETTGFIRSNQEQVSKAAVFLNIDPNKELDSNSIKGITMLVSNAVQGLEPENVTVHGSDGRVLNVERSENDMAFGPAEQLILQQKVKDDLESSLTDFLSTVYGYGNVVVKANVKLDFDSEITERQEFSPPIEGETEGIIRSMEELRESVIRTDEGGIPGTPTNTEDDVTQYVEGSNERSEYNKDERIINYEIDEIRQKIIKAQGQVQDITVAVYLNSNAIVGGSLSDEEISELENLISVAAGLDTKEVKVALQEFNNTLADEIQRAIEADDITTTKTMPIWVWALIAASLFALAYLVYTRRRRSTEEEEIIETPEEIVPELEEIDLELAGSQVKQQLEKLVDKKPDAVAQLLRNWLSED